MAQNNGGQPGYAGQPLDGGHAGYVDQQAYSSPPDYYPGLEVNTAQFTTSAPEVVPDALPEAVAYHKDEYGPPGAVAPETSPRRRMMKWWIVGGVVAVVVIVAVVVGCVVGLRNKSGSSSTSNSPSPSASSPASTQSPTTSFRSTCSGTVCPQVLAAAVVGSTPTLSVFARDINNSIYYASADASAISPAWPSDKTWEDLGGGPYLSQPVAAAWEESSVMSVVALSDPDHSVRLRTFNTSDSQWNSTWESVNGDPASSVSLCTVNLVRLDLWAAYGGVIEHNFFLDTSQDFWSPSQGTSWQGSVDFGQNITTRPGIACRNNTYLHDLVVYGSDKTVLHSIYNNAAGEEGWSQPYSYGSKYLFQGDPVVLATTNERVDFFGIGTDNAMYHFSWTNQTGHSSMESLGGSFVSVPSAVVTGDGRIDVLALGSNGTLLHQALQSGSWNAAWEDLGVNGNSAPLLVNLTTTQPEKVVMFVLGENGAVNQTTWTVSSDFSWQGLSWSSMGGNMTTVYYN